MLTESYHVEGIILVMLTLKGVLYYFRSQGKIKLAGEMRLWNWLLLLSFAVMGGLGLLMTVMLEQEMIGEVKFYALAYWLHIEAGIVMSVVATLHVFFHRRYYWPRRIQSKT